MRNRPYNEAARAAARKAILLPKIRSLIKEVRPATPERRLRRTEALAARPAEIKLHQQANAVRAAPVRADGIYAVAVIKQDFPAVGRRVIQDAAAHAVEPVAGLFLAGQIIHERAAEV